MLLCRSIHTLCTRILGLPIPCFLLPLFVNPDGVLDSGFRMRPDSPSLSDSTEVQVGSPLGEERDERHGKEKEANTANVSTSSKDSSNVDQASDLSEKSALTQQEEELLMANLREKRGDLAEGQRISTVRQTLEADFDITSKKKEFEFIQEIQKDMKAKKEDCPVITNSTFSSINEYQSKIQDGRGGSGANKINKK